MKFILQEIKVGCRVGIIDVESKTIPDIETPMCMLYTRAGTVPNLTRDVLDRIENPPRIVHIPLPPIIESHEAVKAFGKGIKKFIAMEDFVSYCSVQDPAVCYPTGYNSKAGVSLWGKAGRLTVDVNLFCQVMESFKPDWCQVLCDSDTGPECSRKKIQKAAARNKAFLETFSEKRNTSEILCNTVVFGTVSGGFEKDERVKSAKSLASSNIDGIVFEGFHTFGAETAGFEFQKVAGIMKDVNEELASAPEKLRIWHGILSPQNVLNAVECGIDIMDSSYPHIVTEKDSALVFNYKIDQESTQNLIDIQLKDKLYFDDMKPILDHCECYTCTNHSRSYICHLLNTSELLAGVLLNIHNYHHYFRFFEALRRSLKNDTYTKFKTLIDNQSQNLKQSVL